MESNTDPTSLSARIRRTVSKHSKISGVIFASLLLSLIAVEPALAQGAVSGFCETQMAQTIKNLFALLQLGGPLVGGVLALGATVSLPMVRKVDKKKEFKDVRTSALIWGVIVAPLGTEIVQFLLNNVVAGGVSCGF